MKKYLKEQIKEIVKQALGTGILEPDRIRMISVGPLHGAELMGIWFSNEWDRYEYLDDKEPYAAFSLHEWRDELLSREHSVAAGKDHVAAVHQSGALPLFYPGFADSSLGNTKEGKANHATTSGGQHPIHSLILSALQDLKKDLQESLRELASEKPFSDFSGTVALCEFGLSHSSHPVAIAYCHPDYNGRLYSLMEHRGDEILYPDGCFTDDAIIVFFPEGEDEDEQEEPTSQKYALDAVESYSLQDRRDNEVIFRFRGELTDWRLGPGHHDEDMGWPSSEETGARIIQFFGQKPELRFSPEEFPDPTNSKAVTSWLDRFVRSGSRKGTRLVRQIIEDYGLDGVPVLLDAAAMQDFSDRPTMELTFISELVDAGRYQMALDRIQNLVRQNPHFADDTRESLLHCYIGLERWEDAWSAIQGYRKKLEIPLSELDSKGAENSEGKALPSAMAAFELLLALRLERQSEAIVAQSRKALEEAKSEDERLLQIGLLLWAETENASSATPSGGKGNREAAQEIVKELGETLGVSSAQPSVILRRILSSGPVPQLNSFLPILKSQELLEISQEWQQSSRSLETLNGLRKAQNTSAAEIERIEAILADRRTMDYSEVPGHWWMPERTFRTDLKRPFRISLRGETIFGTDDDGLFALNSQSGRLNRYPIPKSRVRSYAFHPQNDSIVYAMDKVRGFIIYDLNEETVKGERASSHWAQFDYIATRGHLLAIGGGVVDFYDISDPLQPEYLTTIGLEYRDAGSFLLEDDRLYLMIARKGLFTLDISALSRAKSDYKLLAHIPWNRGGQYRLERYQNYLLADGGAIVFDLSNSDNPNLIAANDLSLESQAFEMDGSLWAADNDARILFFESGNLAGENRKIQFEHRKELDDESTESLDEADLSKATPQFRASEALAMNDRVLIRQGDDFLLMRRIPSPTSGAADIINLLSPVR